MRSLDIVNGLARSRNLQRYLEIGTPGAGPLIGAIEAECLITQHRLLYGCPEGFDDGCEITFRTAADGPLDLIRAILAMQQPDQQYDLICVQSGARRTIGVPDLHGAFCLLRPGGVLIVEGCNPGGPVGDSDHRPEHGRAANSEAFVEFVLAADPAGYCVVDDEGAGIVFSRGTAPLPTGFAYGRPSQSHVFAWSMAGSTPGARQAYVHRHRTTFLNLIPAAAFAQIFGIPVSDAASTPASAPPSPAPQPEPKAPATPRPELEARFTRVFSTNQWLDGESISGPGSRLNSGPVVETLAVLKMICNDYNITSLNDIPCGDLNWIVKFLQEMPNIAYTGFDIVGPLIERNRQAVPTIDCRFLDITSQVPPRADLVLCKDLIIHLDDADIDRTLGNIKASGSEYLLLSNNFGMPNNDLLENIHGDSACRYVDILAPPFGYSAPAWRSQYLGLWKLSDLAKTG